MREACLVWHLCGFTTTTSRTCVRSETSKDYTRLLHRKCIGKLRSSITSKHWIYVTEALLFPSCVAFDGLHNDIKIFIVGLSHRKLLRENRPPGEREPTIVLDIATHSVNASCSCQECICVEEDTVHILTNIHNYADITTAWLSDNC